MTRKDAQPDPQPDPGSLKKRADVALANRTPLAEWSLGTLVTRDGATLLAIYLGGSDKTGEILGGGFVLNMLSAQRFAADLESVLNTEIAVRGLIRESLGRALRDSRESEVTP